MTNEEFTLNDPNNLNPIIPIKPLPKTDDLFKDKKEEQIKEWNEKKEVKENNIEAIDKNKFKKIGKIEIKILIILAFLGILSFIVIAGSVGYSVYTDGSLVPKIVNNLTCESQIVNIDKGICPACPICPACNPVLSCGNLTFPKEINLVIKNETD